MKRNKSKLWIVGLIALCMLASLSVFATGGKMDSSLAITPQYEAADGFSDGYAAVMKDGKWGYIDETGKAVVDFKYDVAYAFSEGVAVAAVKEDLGDLEGVYVYRIVSADGKEVVLDKYTEAVEEGIWQCHNGVVNVVGTPYTAEGTEIVPVKYPEGNKGAYDYYYMNGSAVDGVIPVIFGYLGQADGTTTCAYMDMGGVVTREFAKADWTKGTGVCEAYAPDNGLIVVQTLQGAVEDQPGMCYVGYGVMDAAGKFVAEPEYLDFYYSLDGTFFDNGVLPLCNEENKWGAINEKGETVIKFEYQWIGVNSDGYMPAQKADGSYVYLDAAGKEYGVLGVDGKAADVAMMTSFGEDGIAAVYGKDGKAFCIYGEPVDGAFAAVQGSDNMDAGVYFPGYAAGVPVMYVEPAELVAISVDGKYGYAKLEVESENPFVDVATDKFYYDPVMWAVEEGITTGKTATTFEPGSEATRGEVVTFLWRAAGCPEAEGENPFKDVAAERFYYEAVLWAVEEGITTGKTADTFDPDSKATRGEIVTFLYRVAGEPEAAGENPFKDVDAKRFYYDAVLWAAGEGITNGKTADTFAPADNCTRGEIVTFLYRFYN